MLPEHKRMTDPFEALREENRELRKRQEETFTAYMANAFAVGLLTGYFPPFNDHTMKIARDVIEARKKDWLSRGRSEPPETK